MPARVARPPWAEPGGPAPDADATSLALAGMDLGVANARPGDKILVSGPIGDHGVTIMLARGELDIEAAGAGVTGQADVPAAWDASLTPAQALTSHLP